jgi:hypothetical protein
MDHSARARATAARHAGSGAPGKRRGARAPQQDMDAGRRPPGPGGAGRVLESGSRKMGFSRRRGEPENGRRRGVAWTGEGVLAGHATRRMVKWPVGRWPASCRGLVGAWRAEGSGPVAFRFSREGRERPHGRKQVAAAGPYVWAADKGTDMPTFGETVG